MFDLLIVQPVFNLLFLIYGLLPGHDFGIAILIFTVVVRAAMFPLVRKQIRQSKAIRELQPEIKKLKKQANGDKQQEAMLTMQLYKDRNVSAFGPLGTLLIQMPIIIGLFQAMRWISNEPTRLIRSLYEPVGNIGFIKQLTAPITERFPELNELSSLSPERLNELNTNIASLIDSGDIVFDQTFLGIIDLSRQGFESGGFYIPLVIVSLIAGFLQYFQSKQIMVDQGSSSKSVKDILKDAGDKPPDQAELNAAMMKNMRFVFPVITIFFSVSFPGSLALYWAASSFFAVLQQRYLLNNEAALMKGVKEPEVKTRIKTEVKSSTNSRKKVTNQAKKKTNTSKKKGSKK